MPRDRLYEALQIAAAPTLERIRQDREQLPHQLTRLMTYVEENLFEPELKVGRAKRETRTHGQWLAVFSDATETTLHAYIKNARLETGDRLLRRTDFGVTRISVSVGYDCHATFIRAYKEWTGERPSDVRGKPNAPGIDYPTWRRTLRGELEPEEATDFLKRFLRLYPDAGQQVLGSAEESSAHVEVDGELYARYRAEQVWQTIRELSPDVQRRKVRRHRFRSTALFDVLREKSREEGRRDRQRGVALARLALDSLEGSEDYLGERIHDQRALGHAWLANAYRLAHDFPAADAEFESAYAEWHMPRREKDVLMLARIRDLEAALRILQRSYGEAFRLVQQSLEAVRSSGDSHAEVTLLLQRAAIHTYTGQPEASIASLQVAAQLLDEQNNHYLAYAVFANMASDLAKVGRYSAAAENLSRCREHHKQLDDPLGALKIQWVDAMIRQGTGDLSAAENLLVVARGGYAEAEEHNSLGIISLDLSILYAEQGRWAKVLKVASDAILVLQSRRLHEETLASVTLLSQAVKAGQVSSSLLQEVRDKVRQDPLAGFAH